MNGQTGGKSEQMYRILLSSQARRYYKAAPRELARRLARAFEALEHSGTPKGARGLKGSLAGLHRLRVGNHRIVYEVIESQKRIDVLKIGPRKDVYR